MAKRIRGILESLLGRRQDGAISEVVSDSELLQRFIALRDEAAFELLMWRHGAMVLGVCRRAIRDLQLAEDAFQAVFIVLARKAGSIRGGNVAGWLFRVARRVAARAIRRHPMAELPADLLAKPQSSRAEHQELTEILDAEVARLPNRLRRVVILCYLGGHTAEDAARELGCPRGTVLSRLASARKRLAVCLSRRGVTLSTAVVALGIEPASRLISATITGALHFLSGTVRPSCTASILAEGVIQAMTRGTLATAFACAILAAALAGGVGWVAAQAQTTSAGMTQVQPRADQPMPVATPTAPALRSEDKPRDQQLRRLEQLHAELVEKAHVLEQRIAQLRERTRNESLGATIRLRTAQSEYDIDRELAVEELREAAIQARTARKNLANTASILGNDVKETPALQVTRKRLESAEKELTRRREELRNLNGQHLPAIEQLREVVAKSETQYVSQIKTLEEDLEVVRESRASLNRQIMAMQSGLPPATSQPAFNEAAGKLDALLREVGQLRKDVRELKK